MEPTTRKICIVGLGRLGSSLLNSCLFKGGEFELSAGFDTNINRIEFLDSPVPLYPAYKMEEVIKRFNIESALLCVPAESAQTTLEKLAAAGIKGIINFSPLLLEAKEGVRVRNINVIDDLKALYQK